MSWLGQWLAELWGAFKLWGAYKAGAASNEPTIKEATERAKVDDTVARTDTDGVYRELSEWSRPD
jgi:hypothetical protein